MSQKRIGGIIGNPSEPASTGTASGVFTISAARQYNNLGKWPPTPTAPTPPTDTSISGITDGFTVSFTAPSTSGGTAITGYSAEIVQQGYTKTYTVTVASGGVGNKYYFNGSGTYSQTIDLHEGFTYSFDQSDASNSGHPLRFSTTSDGGHGGGTEYTVGVSAAGTNSAGAITKITVASGAPTLHYYCTNHSGMGGQANTPAPSSQQTFISADQTSVDFTGFEVDIPYQGQVRATNRYGTSEFGTASSTAQFSALTDVELVVQAGGGGGGYAGDGASGGGGAGGLVYGTNVPITGGVTYTITVGAGASSSSQSNGGNSSAIGCKAIGGGHGGRGTRGSHAKGKDGGCGGGGSGWDAYQDGGVSTQTGSGTIKVGATATTTMHGHDGACAPGLTGTQGAHPGSGGGAGEIGGTDGGQLGGDGVAISWFVSATYTGFHGNGYIGGGGGAGNGAGGDGGGGNGQNFGNNAVAMQGKTGTGGGGGSTYNGGGLTYGGTGGNGTVIIRYLDSAPLATTTGTPAVTATGGYRYYIFTGNGTISWSL